MLGFICMGIAELWWTDASEKFEVKNKRLRRESNQRSLTFHPGDLDHWATLTVVETCLNYYIILAYV